MLLVDTDAVVMHLINQVKKGAVKNLEYVYSKTYHEVSIIQTDEHWTAIIHVDKESKNEFPRGTVVLKKDGCPEIRGFFYRHRTPLLYEYARDFCMRVDERTKLPAIQELIKEALPGLKLS